MVIYLRHPYHGTKVAVLEAEAEADIMEGWVRFDPYDDANLVIPQDRKADDLVKQYTDKFGKAPHWKMKKETIKKALEA